MPTSKKRIDLVLERLDLLENVSYKAMHLVERLEDKRLLQDRHQHL